MGRAPTHLNAEPPAINRRTRPTSFPVPDAPSPIPSKEPWIWNIKNVSNGRVPDHRRRLPNYLVLNPKAREEPWTALQRDVSLILRRAGPGKDVEGDDPLRCS